MAAHELERWATKMPLRGPSVRQRVALKNQQIPAKNPPRPETAAHYTVRFAVLQQKEKEAHASRQNERPFAREIQYR